ncbi:ABC transporter permease [Dyadobacter sp. CY327]|uniref:ABC transporter permease n=1 Tax=Dyadobacter sp. CY327 TaxID=2907301 RepID=UPI001F485B5D|nr:ABC transporter permease [Dyadobacter sp. CY327]MCE7072192.1 ABC transporter permease [Dyadobacter sp. CY327]
MLANYLKIALRIIRKDNTFTVINVVGLATGLAVALLIIQYVRFELSYEKSYPLSEQVVRISMDYLNNGALDAQDAEMYPPVGPRAMREMSEVVNFTRAYPLRKPNVTVQLDDKYYLVNNVYAVDSAFFSMFHYPLLRGSRKNLFTKPRQVILTESLALTYFNTLDVLGKTLKMPRRNGTILLEVVGVVPDSPANTHLKLDMIVSYPTMVLDFGESDDNWNNNNTYTYLQLDANTTYEAFTKSLAAFSDRLVSEKKIVNERVVAQKISDIHLHSNKTYETEPGGDAQSVYFLLGVAFLVLLTAFVNYVNLTTSKALDRAREIGMRKVVGSTSGQIRTQIFMEAVLINGLAGIVAVVLVAAFASVYIEMAGLPEGFVVFEDAFFWESLGTFLLLSISLSGFYPAFVLSSFDPAAVLKGQFSRSAKGVFLRKALVVFQFTVTIILLVQTFAVYRQVKFLRQQNLGLNMDHTLVVEAPVASDAHKDNVAFKQMLLAQSNVKSVSFSGTVPGLGSTQMGTTTGLNPSGAAKKTYYNYYITEADTSFFSVMGVKLLAGKNFDALTIHGFSDTTNRQLIVNEETIRLWGFATPEAAIGKGVDMWGRKATIRGVVKNYHYESPKAAHIPIIHLYSPYFRSFASVKFTTGNADEQLASLKKVYEANFPYAPFSYFFLDSEYDKQYKSDDRFQQVFGALTGFAILISCFGLFGLATFTVSKRTKEIGIRKVIGASTTSLMLLLSKDFIRTASIAILIGLPITFLLVKNWLAHYAVRIELSWWLFSAPALLVMVLVLISIGGKTVATALMNPVKSLRSE